MNFLPSQKKRGKNIQRYTANDENMMDEFKRFMKERFAMSDFGKTKYFLGIEVNYCDQGIFINQHKHGYEVVKRF
jgi:histidinol phosphatase-like PHP family hydrolase